MSTPEKSLTDKIISYGGGFGTLFSIGSGIYGAVAGARNWAGVNAKLDQILAGQKAIKDKVDKVYGGIEAVKLQNISLKEEKAIRDYSLQYITVIELATRKNRKEKSFDQKFFDQKFNELLEDLQKCDNHLKEIHETFTAAKPYMALYADIVKHSQNDGTQSQYFYALSEFERWLVIQRQGIVLLGNLYQYNHPRWNTADILEQLEEVTHGYPPGKAATDAKKVSRMKIQAEYSAQFLTGVDTETGNINRGSVIDSDFIAFGINTCDPSDIFQLDVKPVWSDPGNIVVGLQLYRNRDKLAIKIIQAGFSKGIVGESPTHKDNQGDVRDLISKKRVKNELMYDRSREEVEEAILKHHQIYIDLSSAEAPSGEIMTGAKLYLRGNWICIGIQAAKLNSSLTEIDESTRRWIDAKGPTGKAKEGQDYYAVRGTAKYINIHAVMPEPLAPLRGVRLSRDFTGNDHRLNLIVKTGLCDIKDIWKKYDVSTMASAAALLAEGYEGKVMLKDSHGLRVDHSTFASNNDFVFDLTVIKENKIRFECPEGVLAFGQAGLNHNPYKEFEWFPMDDGSIILKAENGKFLGRVRDREYAYFVADQPTEKTAERFQLVPKS